MATKDKHPASSPRKRPPVSARALPLSEVRSKLSPLVARGGAPVGITVHGRVAAYLVPAEHLEALQRKVARMSRGAKRPDVRGTVEIVGDLKEGRAAINRELDESLARTAAELLK